MTALDRLTQFSLVLALAVCAAVAPASAQSPDAGIVVRRADGQERTISARELRALRRVEGRATFHGADVRFEGVDLRGVLRAAGVSPVDSLRGNDLRRILVFVGADGYSAAIALSDLDPSIGGREGVLVDREDGEALPADRGPYRIIIVGDHRPSRWVRQVVRIELHDLPPLVPPSNS